MVVESIGDIEVVKYGIRNTWLIKENIKWLHNMSSLAGSKIKTRCPKCKSMNFKISEVFKHFDEYVIEEGILIKQLNSFTDGSCSFELHAECSSCGNTWKPNGYGLSKQIV